MVFIFRGRNFPIPTFSWRARLGGRCGLGLFRRRMAPVEPSEVIVELGGFGDPPVEPANLDAWEEHSDPR